MLLGCFALHHGADPFIGTCDDRVTVHIGNYSQTPFKAVSTAREILVTA